MTTRTRPTTTDRLRRWWYLTRFDLAMQGYPRKEAKAIQADLRREVDATAADVGMPQALADLGAPRRLADGYDAQLDRPRPRLLDGFVVATLVGYVVLFSWLSYAFGSIDTLTAQGGGSADLSYLGVPMTTTGGADGISVAGTLSVPALLLLVTVVGVAFALGARLWRALPVLSGRAPA